MRFPTEVDVAIIGAGSAGVAAGRRLAKAKSNFIVLEARARAGGRALTVNAGGFPVDVGCGWLHSADENPWSEIAEELGLTVDRSEPPWGKPALEFGFSAEEQRDFRKAMANFYERLDAVGENEPDRPLADFLEPGGKWNSLLNAISTYVNGVELGRASIRDYIAYEDTGKNWRVVEGYGKAISVAASKLPIVFDCPVKRVDHSGKQIGIETDKGTLTAKIVIVTIPTQLIADESLQFTPALPNKIEAAKGLPLGLADKAFLRLKDAEQFPKESRLFGKIHSLGAANYHIRPFGRPIIEAYFGGKLARDLEGKGSDTFGAFAIEEIASLVGNDIKSKLEAVAESHWSRDPFARGSYSYALPGHADARQKLATPVDDRLFFVGEACSPEFFSTAHGAYRSGEKAASEVAGLLEKP